MPHDPHALDTEDTERLVDAFLAAAKKPDLMSLFIQDLLTENEIRQCVCRLYIAYKLSLRTPYAFLEESTGLSAATIAKIAKRLKNKNGGYNQMHEMLYPREFGVWDGRDFELEEFKRQLGEI